MIQAETQREVVIVRLNRPDKANSLTAMMLEQLVVEFERAANAKALILTGAGDKVFSAGADLDEARAGLATSPLWEQVSGVLAALPCPTIVALNGTLAGGAFGMALACDIRLSVPAASFFYPVAKLGFLPQPSDPGRLKELIGPARTKLLLMSGAKISADVALAYGLVDRIVAPEILMAEARALCDPAVSSSAENVQTIKAMIR